MHNLFQSRLIGSVSSATSVIRASYHGLLSLLIQIQKGQQLHAVDRRGNISVKMKRASYLVGLLFFTLCNVFPVFLGNGSVQRESGKKHCCPHAPPL